MNNDAASVDSAFEILLEEIEKAVQAAQDVGSAAFESGRLEDVRRMLARSEALKAFWEKVARLRNEWDGISSRKNSAAKAKVARSNSGRIGKGMRTPESAYYLPILRVLRQLGGTGRVSQVLELVYAEMEDRLRPANFQPMPSGRETRWRNTAQWARYSMVEKGLLDRNAPRRFWTITPKGMAYLRENDGE